MKEDEDEESGLPEVIVCFNDEILEQVDKLDLRTRTATSTQGTYSRLRAHL